MTYTHILRGRTKVALLLTAMALPLAGAAGAHARRAQDGQTAPVEVLGPNLLVNSGFERGIDPGRFFVFPTGDTSSLIQGWALLNAGLDKFHPAVVYVGTYLPCEEGKRCIELANGGENTANIGGVKQSFATTIGQKYHLSFYQSADIYDTEPRTVKVTVAGQAQSYNDRNRRQVHLHLDRAEQRAGHCACARRWRRLDYPSHLHRQVTRLVSHERQQDHPPHR